MCRLDLPYSPFYINLKEIYASMKDTQMPPVHAANLVANGGNIASRVEDIAARILYPKMDIPVKPLV